MGVGEVRPWRVRDALPVGGGRGEVRVLRADETPLARYKEALFSVASSGARDRASARSAPSSRRRR